jgi:hypothetical protein
MDFWVVSGVPYQRFRGAHVDFLILVGAEGIKTTSSVLCGAEQVAVAVNLRVVLLAWTQCRRQWTTHRRNTKEVNILRCAER